MNKLLFISLMLIVLSLSGCENEQYQLIVSPGQVHMTDNDSVFLLHLATNPGSTVRYTLSDIPEWITVSPLNGEIRGSIAEISFRQTDDSLKAGLYSDVIKLTTDNKQVVNIPVRLAVKLTPWLKVQPMQLQLPDFIFETEFSVKNTGNGNLTMSASSGSEWLKINYGYAVLPASASSAFKVSVAKNTMTPGYYESNILLTTGHNQTVAVPVTVRVPAIISLKLNSYAIAAGYFASQMEVVLTNQGNIPVGWNAQSAGHFTLTPSSGTLPMGESIRINLAIDRKKLSNGTNPSNIVFNTDSTSLTLSTTVNHFTETKMALPGNLKDAAYCKETGQLITVSSFPHQLSVIDPDDRTLLTIPLNLPPICVAVNKANTKAVVGHQGRISVVNLSTRQLEKEYMTLCTPLDILLSSNDWAYVFQGHYGISSNQIHCVNLETGKTTLSTSAAGAYFSNMIYADIDPTGNFIYGISYNSFPAHLHKFDISKGVAKFLYSSEEHGMYEMGDRLWIDESGTKIFTEGKTVFKSSTVKANDFNYLGTFKNTSSSYFNSLAHSKSQEKVYVVPMNLAYAVVYNETSMTPIQQYPLENFLVESAPAASTVQAAYGQFIFVDAAGTNLYAITKAANYEQWGLQLIEL